MKNENIKDISCRLEQLLGETKEAGEEAGTDAGLDADADCEDDEDCEDDPEAAAWDMPFGAAGDDGTETKAARAAWACRLCGFFIPALVLFLIMAGRRIFPFGEESFLRSDMYHQYAPFFSEFAWRMQKGKSLLYSFNIGLGVNFLALAAYYLASPLNLFIIFVPQSGIIEFMTGMVILKTGLAGLSMTYFLEKHFGHEKLWLSFFGSAYALSGYMCAYSWNIMWLDCIVLFPLVILGLHRLVAGRGSGLYTLALFFSIMSNYYISMMTCAFLVIYFVWLFFSERKKGWREGFLCAVRFCFFSMTAGGMAAFLLLPEAHALLSTASADMDFPTNFYAYFSAADVIVRHLVCVPVHTGLEHWPNIYCGVMVLPLVLLFPFLGKVAAGKKFAAAAFVIFFAACFSVNVLNFIWHGLHYPNSLPARQAYIYIFFMLFIAASSMEHIKEARVELLWAVFLLSAAFIFAAQCFAGDQGVPFWAYYLSFGLIFLYAVLITAYRRGNAGCAAFLGAMLVFAELAVNTAYTSIPTTSRTEYLTDNAQTRALAEAVDRRNLFARVKSDLSKTKNDGAWLHFPSASLFSSTADAAMSDLYERLGCESSVNSYSINGATPFVDALFGIRYNIRREDEWQEDELRAGEDDLRRPFADCDGLLASENRYTGGLGFGIGACDFEDELNDAHDPAFFQNSLAGELGAGDVLVRQNDVYTDGGLLSFYPEKSGEYFAMPRGMHLENVTVMTRFITKTYDHVDRGYFLSLGYCEEGSEVLLESEDQEAFMDADIFYFSPDAIKDAADGMNRQSFDVSVFSDTYIKGTICMEEDGQLFLSIPYDDGWTVSVDGERAEKKRMLMALTGVELSAGDHVVELSYFPAGLFAGGIISAASFAAFAAAMSAGALRRKRMIPKTQ